MAQDDGYKATFSIKADSMPDLVEALECIAHAANTGIALEQKVSASVAISSPSIENLQVILDAAADKIAASLSEAEVSTKAPLAAYAKRRLDATPMERELTKFKDVVNALPSVDSVELRGGGRVVKFPGGQRADEDAGDAQA